MGFTDQTDPQARSQYPAFFVLCELLETNNNNKVWSTLGFWISADSIYNPLSSLNEDQRSNAYNIFLAAIMQAFSVTLKALPPGNTGYLPDGVTPVKLGLGTFSVARYDTPAPTDITPS